MKPGRHRQGGSITVVMVAVIMAAMLGCGAIAQLGGLVSQRAHASAVADAAALAAATELSRGLGTIAAQHAASEIARMGGARLESCFCADGEARVTVSVRVSLLGASVIYARARAALAAMAP